MKFITRVLSTIISRQRPISVTFSPAKIPLYLRMWIKFFNNFLIFFLVICFNYEHVVSIRFYAVNTIKIILYLCSEWHFSPNSLVFSCDLLQLGTRSAHKFLRCKHDICKIRFRAGHALVVGAYEITFPLYLDTTQFSKQRTPLQIRCCIICWLLCLIWRKLCRVKREKPTRYN